jgi:hypothetical protein
MNTGPSPSAASNIRTTSTPFLKKSNPNPEQCTMDN